jgi:hypothetical protein
MPSSCLAIAAWAGVRRTAARHGHVLRSGDRGRQVVEPLGDRGNELRGLCVLRLLLRDQAQGLLGPSNSRRQLGAGAGKLADLAEGDTEPVRPAFVDKAACVDGGAVNERHDDRGEQPGNREHAANSCGREQLAFAGRLQLRLSNLDRGLVAIALRLQLCLQRVGFGLVRDLDAPGVVLRGELGLEFRLGLDRPGLGSAGGAGFASLEQAHPGCLPRQCPVSWL